VKKNQNNYKIIFNERDRIINEEDIFISEADILDYDEINELREIVLDVQSQKKCYLTTT
jgi:hypothetical protein